MEARGFREAYDSIKENNAELIGVSPDSDETLKKYRAKMQLPYLLAGDPDKEIIKAWGINKRFGVKRVTVVIEKGGQVRNVAHHEFLIPKHISGALKVLKGMT
ncbi:MAG TPA: redoxin domain-containing protein [Myxococcales bacterium]|nr:redoxin domain-containing protein [Myxococcales bacterium]HIN85538.1 redoxin domain-containing protein [Myxococcales bacterium]